MYADVAGFVLAYHDSPWRCCLWIEVTRPENGFPLCSAYIVLDLLSKQNKIPASILLKSILAKTTC
jgi:hypothetical protein